MRQATDEAIVLSAPPNHRFIAIEGAIGVGKTTLCKKLANTFNYHSLLENADGNPFLERFYNNENVALATQLHFLFQRSRQLKELHQNDIFQPCRVADFLIEKDNLFAQANLDTDEYALYQQVYNELQPKTVRPDLVIYLQAPVDTLIERIIKRGIISEKFINRDYLAQLNNVYSQFFLYYDDAPLLIINATDIDFADNDQHYQQLLSYIQGITSGRHFFNPAVTV
jgi:deoxyadenosine/deoxycytidine kinase